MPESEDTMDYNAIKRAFDDIHNTSRIKKIILDTDTYNEVDDQFALSYAIAAKEYVNLLSVNAAPFFNCNSTSPGDGMEKSYNEILKIFELTGVKDIPAYRGSTKYLTDENTPEVSDAAQNIIDTALSMPDGELLYVLTIGAGTNVASALIMNPDIASKICIIWLAGNSLFLNSTVEFNLIQDVAAGRVIFNSGAALVQVPADEVCDHLTTSVPELQYCIGGKNALCDYLVENVRNCFDDYAGRTRVIWDIASVAMFCVPDAFRQVILPTPIITYDKVYSQSNSRPPYIYTEMMWRDAIFIDLFEKLKRF